MENTIVEKKSVLLSTFKNGHHINKYSMNVREATKEKQGLLSNVELISHHRLQYSTNILNILYPKIKVESSCDDSTKSERARCNNVVGALM